MRRGPDADLGVAVVLFAMLQVALGLAIPVLVVLALVKYVGC